MQLSLRLEAIKNLVPKSLTVADIGTDHAYLSAALIEGEKANRVIASDISEGPLLAAKRTVKQFNYQDKIELRLGNGLGVLEPKEVDTVVIAGMGAGSIIDILTAFPEVTGSINAFVLQPMIAASRLRQWLLDNQFYIADEDLVFEDNRLYEIILAIRGEKGQVDPILYEIGPVLWNKRHFWLKQHIKNLINKHEKMLAEMSKSDNAKNSDKYYEVQHLLVALRERLTCL